LRTTFRVWEDEISLSVPYGPLYYDDVGNFHIQGYVWPIHYNSVVYISVTNPLGDLVYTKQLHIDSDSNGFFDTGRITMAEFGREILQVGLELNECLQTVNAGTNETQTFFDSNLVPL